MAKAIGLLAQTAQIAFTLADGLIETNDFVADASVELLRDGAIVRLKFVEDVTQSQMLGVLNRSHQQLASHENVTAAARVTVIDD